MDGIFFYLQAACEKLVNSDPVKGLAEAVGTKLPLNLTLLLILVITVRNEVAKVMFLHACVCPQGRGSAPEGCLLEGGCLVLGVGGLLQGVPGPGGCLLLGRLVSQHALPPPRETATAADGTHPTGMHSCFC